MTKSAVDTLGNVGSNAIRTVGQLGNSKLKSLKGKTDANSNKLLQ